MWMPLADPWVITKILWWGLVILLTVGEAKSPGVRWGVRLLVMFECC